MSYWQPDCTYLMDDHMMAFWLGPTLSGLGLTLITATVIEICSAGSTPIAADLFTRASAPGNGFVFLMAGAATDEAEIMTLRQMTLNGWLCFCRWFRLRKLSF